MMFFVLFCGQKQCLFRLETFDISFGVFFAGLFQIDVADIGQGTQPGEDVGEFLALVLLIFAGKGGRKLPYFFNEPQKRLRHTPLPVPLLVFGGYEPLELVDVHMACSFIRTTKNNEIDAEQKS